MAKQRKVCIIGLDCATPQLVFDRWQADLPNIRRLVNNSVYGELESIIPPITVPAWTSMMTGKDPGELGFYGFRNRKDHSYDGLTYANSLAVKEETVWDILSRNGKKCILLGVPQTYPPKPINGCLVSCFLTPSTKVDYTYPVELKEEIERVADGYVLDVDGFRSEDKASILKAIYEMTEKRFRVARHLITSKEWDFFMMVDMGVDRIHHAFWKYFDKEHRAYEPGSAFETAVLDYYRYVDSQVGTLLEVLDEETIVFVVSDHGAKRMDGGICINEWLMQEGYLFLKEEPVGITPIGKAAIDWSRTVAWGEGGYYSRIFLNVKNREPSGIVEPADYEEVRTRLKDKLEALGDEKGLPIETKVYRPQDIYKACNGVPPDLIAVFGDLHWRSVGSLGHGRVHTFENDTGPDDANHAQHGIYIMSDPAQRIGKTRQEGLRIMDVAPTVISLFGLDLPEGMHGKVVGSRPDVYSQDEEEEVRKRLEELGYIE